MSGFLFCRVALLQEVGGQNVERGSNTLLPAVDGGN
jgi:hypothetical protein